MGTVCRVLMAITNTPLQWTHIEQTNKSAIQEKKIRVIFLPADAQTPAKTNGVSHSQDTPSQLSPSPAASTPYLASTAQQGPTSGFEDRPSDNRSLGDAVSSASNPATGGVAAAIAGAVPSRDDAQTQLNAAKEQIAKLTSQLKEQGDLRHRKGVQALEEKGYPKAAQALAHPNQAAGVPLQWVALLCFLFFMVAYLFF
jgi:hypothetical protein